MGRVIAVASGKGGTGKTTITAGVASCLAGLGYKTLAIDADAGLRNLDIVLGVPDKNIFDLYDVLLEKTDLEKALISHPDISGLSVLAAPALSAEGRPSPEAMSALCGRLRERYDFVMIDCPAGLGSGFRLAVSGADEAIIVSTADIVSLRDASSAVYALSQQGIENAKLVVNRVTPSRMKQRGGQNIDDAMDLSGLPLLGLVPEDDEVQYCANNAVALVLEASRGAALAMLNIARRIRGDKLPLMKI